MNYQKMQIDILRKYTDNPITHNLMGHFSDINAYDLSKDLDFVSWDNYPDNQWGTSEYEYVSMAHENMRGAKNKNFVVMEEQAGPAGWDILGSTPRPNQLRLWTYQAIAHGCEGVVYFIDSERLFSVWSNIGTVYLTMTVCREDVFMKFKRQVTNFKNLKNILSAQKISIMHCL